MIWIDHVCLDALELKEHMLALFCCIISIVMSSLQGEDGEITRINIAETRNLNNF